MVIINLLPWRAPLRAQQKKRMQQIILLTAGCTFLLISIMHFIMQNKIQHLTRGMRFYQSVPAPINVTEELSVTKAEHYQQATRDLFYKLMQEHHTGIYFTEINRKDNTVTFSGHVLTAAALTEFLQHWQVAALFTEIKIDNLQYDAKSNRMLFQFRGFETAPFPYAHHRGTHHAAI